ncbi:MAG: fumarate hydratase, partial [Candidatus Acidiferrales bacterium]
MDAALERENPAATAGQALAVIANNIDQAAEGEGAICQDTGW